DRVGGAVLAAGGAVGVPTCVWEFPMMTRSGIRNCFARPFTRPFRKTPFRVRPTLEMLENRWLPSNIVVNNPTDTPVAGETDLREAIAQANTNGGDETITFDPTVFATHQTIGLSGTQLELTDTTGTETITGPAAGVTVSGNLNIIYPANNGFEVPNLGAGISAYGYGSPEAAAAGLPALPPGSGWTFTGTAGIAANGSNFNVNGASNGNSDGTTSTSG